MALCAWALDSTEKHLHSETRNREHVLGQQFRSLIAGGASYSMQRIHLDAEDRSNNDHTSWSSGDPVAWITRAFCERCNGGWMADLDNAARPILERLLDVSCQVELTELDRTLLAAWAFKLSMGFEFVAASTERHDASVRADFFHARAAPRHAAVAVGVATFTYTNALYGVRTGILPFPGAGPTRVCSLLLKHVLLKVSSSCNGRISVQPLDLLPLRVGARMVVHPSPTTETAWPPRVPIDSEQTLVRTVNAVAPFPAE